MAPRTSLLAATGLVAALVATLGLLRGAAFWSTSDGVYALSARELLDGADLYGGLAAAQPPPVYLVGAGFLEVSDGLTGLRAGLALFVLATAALTWLAVLRLSGSTRLALLGALLAPLTPIALHEHALLTPETIGTPLLLGCALLAARPGRGVAAGSLGAACVAVKLPFALPVLLVLLVGSDRRRGLVAATAAGTVLALLATLVWGGEMWRGIVVAQRETGFSGGAAPGLIAQAAWTLLPLVLLASLVRGARDAPLLRTLIAAAVGGVLLCGSLLKTGSYVNVAQLAEPPLLVLAVCGAGAVLRGTPRGRRALLAVLATVLALGQSASLLLAPDDPTLLTRPGAESGPRRLLSPEAVRAAARAARACPPGVAYPGLPFLAFVADRRLPGGQADPFILAAPTYARLRGQARRTRGLCPAGAPAVAPDGSVTG